MAYGGTVDVKNFSRWVVGKTKATHIIKSKRLKKLKFKSCAISQVDNGYNHGDIIYGGTVVRNDDSPATLNLLLFLFSGGSLYTNQRRQRRRPHTLLFLLSFA